MLLTSRALYSHPGWVTAALARARRLRREEHGGVPAGGTSRAYLLCGKKVYVLNLDRRRARRGGTEAGRQVAAASPSVSVFMTRQALKELEW